MVYLAEAKKNDVDAGIAQNIAQIIASREAYIASVFGNEISVLDNIASSGLITTGEKWIFTRCRFVRVDGVGKFIRNSP